jgi:hypothetical protein
VLAASSVDSAAAALTLLPVQTAAQAAPSLDSAAAARTAAAALTLLPVQTAALAVLWAHVGAAEFDLAAPARTAANWAATI